MIYNLKTSGTLWEVHSSDVNQALELGVDMITQEPDK